MPRGPIPPLSQSKQADLACSLLYLAFHVRGMRMDSPAARRGSLIHKLIAQYMDALGISKQKMDPVKLKELSAGSGSEVTDVTDRFGDEFSIEPEKIYDTELYIALNEEFRVVEVEGKSERRVHAGEIEIAYEGTLDLVVMENEFHATIYDWKSYYQIVDADTFQAHFYPLLLFILNPRLETVTFKLTFVRYGKATREVMWKREDMPKLKAMAIRERHRQIDLHNRPGKHGKATPGRQCTWCPLLLTECPVKDFNDYAKLTPADHVGLALYLNAAKTANDRFIKDWLIENGPIEYRDANGVLYEARFEEADRRSYPLGAGMKQLVDWQETNQADFEALMSSLSISGLSSPLKAKKRARLADLMDRIVEIKKITKLKIGRDEDAEEENDESKTLF